MRRIAPEATTPLEAAVRSGYQIALARLATPDELTAFCRKRVASFKVPRHWKFVDGFPMTVTGKVQKYVMREMAIEELGLRDVAAIVTA